MILPVDALAALDLSNLLYVAGAIVVATLISALIALAHRRPKSLESGIESFSRELQALAPEADGTDGRATPPPSLTTVIAVRPRHPAGRGSGGRPTTEHDRSTDRSPTSARHVTDEASTDGPPTPGRPDPSGPAAPVGRRDEPRTREGQAG